MNSNAGSLLSLNSTTPLLGSNSSGLVNDVESPCPYIQFSFQIGFFRESMTFPLNGLTLQGLKEIACQVLEKQVSVFCVTYLVFALLK